MAAFSHEVHPLFVEPYFRANIAGAISPLQVEFIQNLKMVKNPENYISENLYIFEEPELKSIKDAVQEILARQPVIPTRAIGNAQVSCEEHEAHEQHELTGIHPRVIADRIDVGEDQLW